ncbi:MAG: hypothetical protein QOF51_1880, partial [Chloroflexota bacterium]|nr:hypothetical protein [Chloroflexota bacterium]
TTSGTSSSASSSSAGSLAALAQPTPGPGQLAADESAVQSAQSTLAAAQAQLNQLRGGGTAANQAALQSLLETADANVRIAKGRLDTLQSGGSDLQRIKAQGDLTTARESLKAAEAKLAALNNGVIDTQRQAAESQVVAAREKLRADQARLDQLQAGSQLEDIQAAQAAVDQARQQLALAAQPVTDQDIQAQQAAVEQARLQVQKARQPNSDFDIQQQQQAVAQAQATLDGRRRPYTAEDLQAAQATVDQSQALLQLANLGLSDTRITAPVDGIVSERLVSTGALVSSATPIVTLVPPALELMVNVDESQLGQVAEGQSVTLQVAAYPNQTFNGKVATIAPTIDQRSRTTSVKIVPQDLDGKLRAGMLAKLNIVTAAHSGVLVVPKEAIPDALANGTGTVLAIDEANHVHKTPVQVGLVSDRSVEVLGGLREGQVIATSGISNLSDGDLVSPQLNTATALAR